MFLSWLAAAGVLLVCSPPLHVAGVYPSSQSQLPDSWQQLLASLAQQEQQLKRPRRFRQPAQFKPWGGKRSGSAERPVVSPQDVPLSLLVISGVMPPENTPGNRQFDKIFHDSNQNRLGYWQTDPDSQDNSEADGENNVEEPQLERPGDLQWLKTKRGSFKPWGGKRNVQFKPWGGKRSKPLLTDGASEMGLDYPSEDSWKPQDGVDSLLLPLTSQRNKRLPEVNAKTVSQQRAHIIQPKFKPWSGKRSITMELKPVVKDEDDL